MFFLHRMQRGHRLLPREDPGRHQADPGLLQQRLQPQGCLHRPLAPGRPTGPAAAAATPTAAASLPAATGHDQPATTPPRPSSPCRPPGPAECLGRRRPPIPAAAAAVRSTRCTPTTAAPGAVHSRASPGHHQPARAAFVARGAAAGTQPAVWCPADVLTKLGKISLKKMVFSSKKLFDFSKNCWTFEKSEEFFSPLDFFIKFFGRFMSLFSFVFSHAFYWVKKTALVEFKGATGAFTKRL